MQLSSQPPVQDAAMDLTSEAFWGASVPDIQVYQRRESNDESLTSMPAELWEESFAYDDFASQDADEDGSYESYLEELPERSSLLGRIVFTTLSGACIIAMLSMALTHIWAHGQATRLGFAYSQASKKAARLKEDQRLLKLQLAKLQNPKRLARIAQQQLGMGLPARSHVISEQQVLRALSPSSRTNKKIRYQLALHKKR